MSKAPVRQSLSELPGQSVKELAAAPKVNRQFLSGNLTALEETWVVSSWRVGPASINFNVDHE